MGAPARKNNVIPIRPARKSRRDGGGGKSRIGIMVGKGLSDAAMRALEKQFARPKTEEAHRNRAIFRVMRETALRASELLQLTFTGSFQETIKGEPGRVFSLTLKGGDLDGVFISDAALAVVRAYHRFALIESDRLFHSLPLRNRRNDRSRLTTRALQKIINSWDVKTLAGKPVHPHALRHTVIQKAMDEEGGLFAQKIARHRSTETTSKHYLKPYVNGKQLWERKGRRGKNTPGHKGQGAG